MPLEEDTSVVYGLQPRSYVYNSDPASGRHLGYITSGLPYTMSPGALLLE